MTQENISTHTITITKNNDKMTTIWQVNFLRVVAQNAKTLWPYCNNSSMEPQELEEYRKGFVHRSILQYNTPSQKIKSLICHYAKKGKLLMKGQQWTMVALECSKYY